MCNPKMLWILLGVAYCAPIQVKSEETERGLRGPPKVESSPKLINSYIPAAMQIIAHDTELMKYVIKPPEGSTTSTTSTTVRPTPSHKPGLFAPPKPLGPEAFFSKDNTEGHYVEVQQQPGGLNYFERYNTFAPGGVVQTRQLHEDPQLYFKEAEKFLGKSFAEFLQLANKVDPEFDVRNEDNRVQEFSKNFEDPDSSYRYELLRQKRVPPTKAYVTLLSLYDALNKEAKRLMLNKYAGFTDDVVNSLVEFARYSSSYQLRAVLNKIVENNDINQGEVLKKVKSLISDLDDHTSYINVALAGIPALAFSH